MEYPFGTRRYKIRKWCARYFQATGILDIFATIVLVVIACLSFSLYPLPVFALGLIYIVLQATRAFIIFRERRSRDYVHRRAIRQVLQHMNRRMFENTQDKHRLTLFTVDPVNSDYITPYVRFEVGDNNGVEASKARFPKAAGYTGMAWKETESYLCTIFPKFNNREEFEFHYTSKLKIPKDIVEDISDYMENVRQIFCYGFVDIRGYFLGVLSIDSCIEWETDPEAMPALEEMLSVLRTLLDSFFGHR